MQVVRIPLQGGRVACNRYNNNINTLSLWRKAAPYPFHHHRHRRTAVSDTPTTVSIGHHCFAPASFIADLQQQQQQQTRRYFSSSSLVGMKKDDSSSSSSLPPQPPTVHKVAVLGAGSFGSAMVQVLSRASKHYQSASSSSQSSSSASSQSSSSFKIHWYARRQSIVDEINTPPHTNTQYFAGCHFDPTIVHASRHIQECVQDAAVVVVSVPSAYLVPILHHCRDALHPKAVMVSVIKSLHYDATHQTIRTAVDQIQRELPHHAAVALSGPNLYKEMISEDSFAEASIGYDDDSGDDDDDSSYCKAELLEAAQLAQYVTNSPNFQTSLVKDRVGVELCGGLKNVLSLAVGFCEGLSSSSLGWNVRAAVLRAGMHEMTRFIQQCEMRRNNQNLMAENNKSRNRNNKNIVFETAAGMGDVILTCTAGRGRTLAAAFLQHAERHGRLTSPQENIERWDQLEQSLLNGMKLPDWHNAQYVHQALVDWNCQAEFPLLNAVYQIAFEGQEPRHCLISALRESIQKAA